MLLCFIQYAFKSFAKKSRKVTVDDGGFLNPKFFRFPRNESIMIKPLKGN